MYLCFHTLFFDEDVEGTLVDDVKVVTRIPWTIYKEIAAKGQDIGRSHYYRNRLHTASSCYQENAVWASQRLQYA